MTELLDHLVFGLAVAVSPTNVLLCLAGCFLGTLIGVLPGIGSIATISMLVDTMVAGGFATEYDGVIARKLARILCGGPSGSAGPVPEQRILDLERETFLSLCGEQRTLDRMQHMLMHNKPLRN